MNREHNITIARSGVQYYHRNELPKLGLTSIPREFAHLRVFGVYRPSFIVEKCAPMFKGAPVIVGHERWLEDANDPAIIGRVGDEISVKVKNNETTLFSKLKFSDTSYDEEKSELSPGYWAHCSWNPGVSPDGIEYQIISGEITSVNHLALVPKARGGDGIRILDGGACMKKRQILSGLLHTVRKLVSGINDDDRGAFRNTIDDMIKNRVEWTDEEMAEHCTTLLALTDDLPDSEEKEKLLRFIADLPLLKEESEETANTALNMVADLFEQLDTDAVEDVEQKGVCMSVKKTEVEVQIADAMPAQAQAPAATPVVAPVDAGPEPIVPVAEPTLADVMVVLQTIAASLAMLVVAEQKEAKVEGQEEVPADPAAPTEPAAPAAEEPPAAEKKEPGVGDSESVLPFYSQSLAATQTVDGLDDLFAKMKNKKRG